jgi:hypothetical protein
MQAYMFFNNEHCTKCEKMESMFDNSLLIYYVAYLFWITWCQFISKKNFEIQIDLIDQLE